MTRAILARYESDPKQLRETFAHFPSGVVALLAEVDGEVRGMVASAFTVGVSIDPPLVSCAIQRTSSTWPLLRACDAVGISVLATDQGDLARRIGTRPPPERFDGVPLREVGSGALFIAGAPVWLECFVHDEFPAGDHTIALLQVIGLSTDPDLSPPVSHGSTFQQLHLPRRDLPQRELPQPLPKSSRRL